MSEARFRSSIQPHRPASEAPESPVLYKQLYKKRQKDLLKGGNSLYDILTLNVWVPITRPINTCINPSEGNITFVFLYLWRNPLSACTQDASFATRNVTICGSSGALVCACACACVCVYVPVELFNACGAIHSWSRASRPAGLWAPSNAVKKCCG